MAAFIHLNFEEFKVLHDMDLFSFHRLPYINEGLEKNKGSAIVLIPAINSTISSVRKFSRVYDFDKLVIGSGRRCLNPKTLSPEAFLEFKKREEAKGLVITHFNPEYFNECLLDFKVVFEKHVNKLKLNGKTRELEELDRELVDLSDFIPRRDNSENGTTIYGFEFWCFNLTYLNKSDWVTIHLSFTSENEAIEAQNRILSEIDDFYLNYKDYVALNLLKGLSNDKN